MNPDTGEAETPVHLKATSWRRNLDHLLRRADAAADREWEIEDRIASMTPAERDAMLKQAMLDEQAASGGPFNGMGNNGSYDAKPNMRSPMMQALKSGRPISRGELGRGRSW